jgi:prevent-host-death family protein
MAKTAKKSNIVVSALRVRTNFGKLLRQVEDERRSLVIEKRGTPRAVLMSIRDYVKLAAPEPDVLRMIGEESKAKGTDKLTSNQIDRIIQATRARKSKILEENKNHHFARIREHRSAPPVPLRFPD